MRTLLVVLIGLGLGACASTRPEARFQPRAQSAYDGLSAQASRAQPAPTATGAGRYKVGAPYQSGGVWYVPAEQPGYDETGLASWYGDAFNGKPTANGEMFDMHAISAAHATLPMPCMVEVTNLENGRILQVRMNDRGPFHPGRIIDLSRGAADRLGFSVKGTAKVRVRYVGPAPLNGVDAPVALASNGALSPAPSRAAFQTVPPQILTSQPVAQPVARPLARLSPPSAIPEGGAGAFVVQAGAFSNRGAAERVAESLASAGTTAIRPVDRSGATLYRVTVGNWADQGAAQSARAKVVALGYNDARIVPGF